MVKNFLIFNSGYLIPQYDSLVQMLETFPDEQACVEHLEKL